MAQDFAKKRVAADAAHRRPQRAATRLVEESPPTQHWNWFFSGLFCGFLTVGIGYLGLVRLDTGSSAQTAESESRGETASSNRPVFDFGFYGELENAEITVAAPPRPSAQTAATAPAGNTRPASTTAAATATATASPPAAVATARYLLQAGSFQDRQEAENRRAKIILLNLGARIDQGVVSGRTWYRVQVGPFNGRSEAESARDLLSENNIDSIPLLLRED